MTLFHQLEEGILAPELCLFGDNAYLNTSYEATPYFAVSGGTKDAYYFYHLQLQICIECAFGMLTHRWAILQSAIPMNVAVHKSVALVLALTKLHNYCIDADGRSVLILPLVLPLMNGKMKQVVLFLWSKHSSIPRLVQILFPLASYLMVDTTLMTSGWVVATIDSDATTTSAKLQEFYFHKLPTLVSCWYWCHTTTTTAITQVEAILISTCSTLQTPKTTTS